MKKVDWDFYDMEELAEMCKEKGLDPVGRRDALITRLEAAAKLKPVKPKAAAESEPEG